MENELLYAKVDHGVGSRAGGPLARLEVEADDTGAPTRSPCVEGVWRAAGLPRVVLRPLQSGYCAVNRQATSPGQVTGAAGQSVPYPG